MGRVFLSYRRSDSADVSDRIYAALAERFGHDAIFKDIDSIPLGTDFRKVIDDAVESCDVLLEVIGKDWLEAEGEDGERRLEHPDDFVRLEIEAALRRDIHVIPVLVRDARMPMDGQLPASIDSIRFRSAAKVRPDPDFEHDVDRLSRGIAQILGLKLARRPSLEGTTSASKRQSSDDWILNKIMAVWRWIPKRTLTYILLAVFPGEISFWGASAPDGGHFLVFGGIGVAILMLVFAWYVCVVRDTPRLDTIMPRWYSPKVLVFFTAAGVAWALVRSFYTPYDPPWWWS